MAPSAPLGRRKAGGRRKTTRIVLGQALLFIGLMVVQHKLRAQVRALDQQSARHRTGALSLDTTAGRVSASSCAASAADEDWAVIEEVDLDKEGKDDSSTLERYFEPNYNRGSVLQGGLGGHLWRKTNSDVLIVYTVDGTVAGVSKSTGKTLWKRTHRSSDTNDPRIGPEHWKEAAGEPGAADHEAQDVFGPLVSTTTTVRSSSSITGDWRTAAVPSIDGKVFLTARAAGRAAGPHDEEAHHHDWTGAEVTVTTTASNIVSRVPFVDRRGRVYTGSRQSTALAIDIDTGEVLRVVKADSQCSVQQDPSFRDRNVVWMGRVDYVVSIHEPQSGDLDVEFSTSEILSVNDMVLGSGPRQPWGSDQDGAMMPTTQGWPDGEESINLEPALVATPGGILALRDPTSHQITWVAEEYFDSPVAFALDSDSGATVRIDIVPDAASPDGSVDYLTSELERQLRQTSNDVHTDEQTIVGSLSTGHLFAMPLGQRSSSASYDVGNHYLKPASHTANAIAQPNRPQIGGRQHAALSLQENKQSSASSPRKGCHPGSVNFPKCLIRDSHPHDFFARAADGRLLSEATLHTEDTAVIPFFHYADYGYIPPEHFYMLNPDTRQRSYRRLLRILGSWLPPTIALIFVVSFELGRRKRLKNVNGDVNSDAALPTAKDLSSSSSSETGVIQVFDDIILGYGAHGTVVYKGMLDGRQVAVKRMLKAYHASADREISLLIESDGHPNVVRYFLKEIRGDFVYLALELCDLSLHDLIVTLRNHIDDADKENCSVATVSESTKTILFQIASGVRHLHHLRIVHRDLKPANILLADSRTGKSKTKSESDSVCSIFERGYYVAKISDMGLGKQLVGQSSYGGSVMNEASLRGHSAGGNSSLIGVGAGSVGWQAPEIMALRIPSDISAKQEGSSPATDSFPDASPMDQTSSVRTSRSSDIFSLGCIFYTTLVPGAHPFGEWYEREANIIHNRPNLDALELISQEAYDLVAAMIDRNPRARPSAQQICEHPLFWRQDRRLAFLCDFSDRIEIDAMSSEDVGRGRFPAILLAIERNAATVVGTSWDRLVGEGLLSNGQRFRTYDPSAVRDLLRFIRNKNHHFDELSPTVKLEMNSTSDGLLSYFEQRFPRLLMHCYKVCRELFAVDDPLAIKYSIASLGVVLNMKPLDVPVKSSAENQATVSASLGPFDQDVLSDAGGCSDRSSGIEQTLLSVSEDSGIEICSLIKPLSLVDSTPALTADTSDLVIWFGSAAAKAFNSQSWYRSDDEWVRCVDVILRKRDAGLARCAADPKYRTRLCNHWDESLGTFCPMRKKNKCVFAHGPVELRVKENKRNRWGKLVDANGDNKNPNHSGGEDTYGAARSIETERKHEGKWKTDKAKQTQNQSPASISSP